MAGNGQAPFRTTWLWPSRRRTLHIDVFKQSIDFNDRNAAEGTVWSTWYFGASSASLAAGSGSFTLTGEPAILNIGMAASFGSVTLTGVASPGLDTKLVAAAGSFTLTGEPATLTLSGGATLTADTGSFALTGSPVTFDLGVPSAYGSFSATFEASPALDTSLTAGFGAFTLTGEPATLIAGGSATLIADCGTFALTGLDAVLTVSSDVSVPMDTHDGGASEEAVRYWRKLQKREDDARDARLAASMAAKIEASFEPEAEPVAAVSEPSRLPQIEATLAELRSLATDIKEQQRIIRRQRDEEALLLLM